jgi:hypothetical protein
MKFKYELRKVVDCVSLLGEELLNYTTFYRLLLMLSSIADESYNEVLLTWATKSHAPHGVVSNVTIRWGKRMKNDPLTDDKNSSMSEQGGARN